MKSPARAVYRHPAFLPHCLLSKIGIRRFWVQNAVVTLFFAVLLTVCVWKDHSFIIVNGYGYLEHPGVYGWYLFQLAMPVSIYATLKVATRSRRRYLEVIADARTLRFRERIFTPMISFVGLSSSASRSFFSLLFMLGLAGFTWNTLQNLSPGKLAPMDFWDSIHFPFGYASSRLHKFYLDALLLPTIVHIFAGIVWAHIKAIRVLVGRKQVRLAPFNPDKCGGFRFVADLILSPTVSALLLSGLAFFGVIYTHRAFDISTVAGILIQTAVLLLFYVAPTFFLRSVLVQAKKVAREKVHCRQEKYYEAILSGKLHGASLRDAHEYLRYFNEISATIDKIPEWPHFSKVSRVFSISISPAVLSFLFNAGSALRKLYAGLP